MNDQNSNSSQVADSWDTYWHGTGNIGAFSSGGVNHPLILKFWDELLANIEHHDKAEKLLDIASGNGAVVERALASFSENAVEITCIDVSEAAIDNIRDRFPQVKGIVTDAREIPLESGGYDIVTSQFGVEYAGIRAINEAARMVASGGQLALMLHNQQSSIHQECVESLAAIAQLQSCAFIPAAIEMFDAGFKAVRGADREPYETAAKKLAPAISALEDIMRQYGQQVAGETISRLYNDVDQIHQRIQHYEPTEILGWLGRMDGELDAYAGRMSSMSESAIDGEAFERICDDLRNQGFTIERAEALTISGQDQPLAWVLMARQQLA